MQRSPRPLASASFAALFTSLLASLLATLLAPAASAQQVQWKLNPLTAKYVGLTFGTSGWNAAQAQAVAYGGHLVTIRSAAENQWLIDNFSSVWAVQGSAPWHGFNDVAVEGQWRWVSGEQFTFAQWAAGQPDNQGNQDFGHFSGPPGWSWSDVTEGQQLRSLIEVGQLPAVSWSWPINYTTGNSPGTGCLFDFDGDGDLDYASGDSSSFELSIWRNSGSGVYSLATKLSNLSYIQSIAAVDWDKDGDQDLLAINTSQLYFFRNDQADIWTEFTIASTPFSNGLAVADLNSDGLEDVVVCSSAFFEFNGGTTVFLQQPNGELGLGVKYGFGPLGDGQPTAADLDNDGDLDLLVTEEEGLKIMRGTGDGSFVITGSLGSGQARHAIAIDLDQDGRLEVIVAREQLNTIDIWKRSNSTSLAPSTFSTIQTLTMPFPSWLSSEDFDGDGDVDIAVATNLSGSESVNIFNNILGVLTFGAKLQLSSQSFQLVTGDINKDAKPDIISVDVNIDSFSLYFNQSKFDCNANNIDDTLDIASGLALDCNNNGRPDSCDLGSGIGQDSNGDGILNDCDPSLVAIEPGVRAAAQAGTVVVSAVNVPAGAATLTLESPDLASPVVVPITLVAGGGGPGGAGSPVSAQVALPPLFTIEAKGFAQDVVLSGSISWTDGLGATQVTGSTPGVFTWNVPEVAGVQPNSVPFDGANAVLIELEQNVVKQGLGAVRFGSQPAVLGNWIQFAGKTLVSAIAPPQPAPGDYPIELEITAGGVTEFTRIESRALIHLGPGIQAISAISGFQGGGEPVTFSLVGFQPGVPVQVAFGDVSVSGSPVGFLAASTLTVLTPLSPLAGVVDLTLTQVLGPGQVKTAVSPAAFEFVPPEVGALGLTSGPQAGGQALSLATDGFAPGPITVRLGTTVTQGSVVGSGADQTVSWTSVASPAAGLVDLTLVQGVFSVTKTGAYTFLAPQILSVTPSQGSWYQAQSLLIQGQNFAPNLAAGVRFSGESPIAGQVLSSNTIQVNLPAGFLKGAGPLGLIVTQAGVNASLPDAFLCLPALTTSLTGSAAQGGQLRYQVQSQQSGFAIALLSAALSPLPLTLPDIHAGFALDFATSFNVGSGGLLVTPTVQVNFPPLSVPPGTTLQAQALALEFGPLGTWYSFTNTVPVLLP
jgi:hypothetical protein